MKRSILSLLPAPAREEDFSDVRRRISSSPSKVVVLDDDPTGTQTVHGIDVLCDWNVDLLVAALRDSRPCFYLLTNTRSLDAAKAAEVVREACANLAQARRIAGIDFAIISRGDSTLRGHFTEELKAIETGLGPFDATIVIPAFFEGGRYTIGDIHYVADGENLVAAADTEFARDQTFGYSHSNLPEWIEEKTRGRVPAASVATIPIDVLRSAHGAVAVREQFLGLSRGSFVVVNAAAYRDLEAFTRGLLDAEAAGKRYLLRSAASFVRVRAGIEPRPLLSASEIADAGMGGGLIMVGSYVRKTTVQLESLLALGNVEAIELAVDSLAKPKERGIEVRRVASAARTAMMAGKHAAIFTSRKHESALGLAGDLQAGRIVSEALAKIVRAIPERPRFLIAKGGITSCDIALRGLGMRRARVLGQASSGVPVWEMGQETRFPGMRLVVWPGNVGDPDSLRDLISAL